MINLDFLLSRIAHFENSIILLLLVFKPLGFKLSGLFLYFKQYDIIVLYFYANTFYAFCPRILLVSFFLPSSIKLLFSVSRL